jgi:hypothetical protein
MLQEFTKTLCIECGKIVCHPCVPSEDGKAREITVATEEEIGKPTHIRRLAVVWALVHLPRRRIRGHLKAILLRPHGVLFFNEDGSSFALTEKTIEDTCDGYSDRRPRPVEKQEGETEKDDDKWFYDFQQFRFSPPKQWTQDRMFERYQLLDLCIRLLAPDLARWIAE